MAKRPSQSKVATRRVPTLNLVCWETPVKDEGSSLVLYTSRNARLLEDRTDQDAGHVGLNLPGELLMSGPGHFLLALEGPGLTHHAAISG